MKQPSLAPAYAGLYPVLCTIAREKGYALCIHGTMASDMDLLAAPWTEEACSAEELMQTIAEHLDVCMDQVDGKSRPLSEVSIRAHGRKSWAIPLIAGAVIDLSVMPRGQDWRIL